MIVFHDAVVFQLLFHPECERVEQWNTNISFRFLRHTRCTQRAACVCFLPSSMVSARALARDLDLSNWESLFTLKWSILRWRTLRIVLWLLFSSLKQKVLLSAHWQDQHSYMRATRAKGVKSKRLWTWIRIAACTLVSWTSILMTFHHCWMTFAARCSGVVRVCFSYLWRRMLSSTVFVFSSNVLP